jgi:hypothetical protein
MEEGGPIAAGVRPFLRQRMVELNLFPRLLRIPARGDKLARAQAIRGRMAISGLWLPASTQVTAAAIAAPAFQGIDFSNAPPALLALRHPREFLAKPNPDAPPPPPAGGLPVPRIPARACAEAYLRDDWVEPFRAELMSFPAGRHDDQVDALSLIGQLLDQIVPGTALPGTSPLRGARELTMNEAWELCRVKPRDPYGRI